MKKSRLKPLPTIIRWILWVLLVQFILVNISAALYAYKLTHFYTDPAFREHKASKNIFGKTWKLFTGPHYPKSFITDVPFYTYDTVTLKTGSGLSIDAWYAKQDSVAKGTVILFHGITANKSMMLTEGAEFHYRGYNVLLIDFRGHGNSEGKTTTVGVAETEEVKLAYEFVKTKGEQNIFLWGASMGAVVIAKAIGEYSLRPSGIILEMPFASLQSYLRAKAKALGFPGFPEKPFGFLVSCWISIERGYNGFRHRTALYTEKIDCPVLLQWGSNDKYVSEKETQKIFNAIPGSKKKLIVYEKTGHESLLQKEPQKWRKEVGEFLTQ